MDLDSTQKFDKRSFDETCDACGCKYQLDLSIQEGQDDEEQYNCPNPACGKAFSVKAALPPEVTPLDNCG